MSRVQDIKMADSQESKLHAVLKAIEALTIRIWALENLASGIGTSPEAKIPQPRQHIAVEGPTPLPSQGTSCSRQYLDDGVAKYREPSISLPEKFDGTRSMFRGFYKSYSTHNHPSTGMLSNLAIASWISSNFAHQTSSFLVCSFD